IHEAIAYALQSRNDSAPLQSDAAYEQKEANHPKQLPRELNIIAENTTDQVIMGLQHRLHPWFGVQFHPESIGTEFGDRIFANFLQISEDWARKGRLHQQEDKLAFRKTVLAWQEPEEVFAHLFQNAPLAFWLDSSLEGYNGRYSYMGSGQSVLRSSKTHDIAPLLAQNLQQNEVLNTDNLPFKGGWLGYWDYEQEANTFMWVDRYLAFDHQTREMFLCTALPNASSHQQWVEKQIVELAACPRLPKIGLRKNIIEEPIESIALAAKRSRAGYIADIKAIQALIKKGESYEVCLTNEFSAALALDPFYLYRVLRATNPAPFAAYIKTGDLHILSSSPESFVNLTAGGQISSEPIKGTKAIGNNPEETAALKKALRESNKDHAELLMIIDLIRNDLSMICERASVEVPELVRITEYATLLQASSLIRGQLKAEINPVKAICTIFPGGSITGAPKKRTMEIIESFEKRKRGVYTGSIGFFSLDRAAAFNIAIRTMVYQEAEQKLSFGSGGAVLFDSDPSMEYDEIMLKAYALIRALNLSVSGRYEDYSLTEKVLSPKI
ncbi:MAG: chorismate-binding protein, partial [Bacteroidota bacterium]